jgi:hypothetical protein
MKCELVLAIISDHNVFKIVFFYLSRLVVTVLPWAPVFVNAQSSIFNNVQSDIPVGTVVTSMQSVAGGMVYATLTGGSLNGVYVHRICQVATAGSQTQQVRYYEHCCDW